MMSYHYQHVGYSIVAAIGFIAWTIGFFYIGKKSQIFIPQKFKKEGFPVLRSLIFILGTVGWISLAIALAGPRLPIGVDNSTIEVNDIFIVFDLSRSMLAEDLKPNRFVAAKAKIQEFVSLFPRDRIGIILFAEKVFTLLPLSTDLNLINKMVSQIEIDGDLGDGTNIGDALSLGVGRLLQSLAKTKILILMTDGVSNVGVVTPNQAAELAAENKIKIYTIGIGSEGDVKIPVGSNSFGVQRYQVIPGGSVDEKSLEHLSRITGGKSYMASNNGALENVLAEINKLERTEIEQTGKIIYQELFFKYLLYGVLLIMGAELSRRVVLREGL